MALFSKKKFFILIHFILLGLTLSLSFDPYNIPFLSLLGLFFILNDKI